MLEALPLTIPNPTPSWNPLEDLAILFHYDFMVHAFQAGTIVAMVAGSIGYFVVLRGSSFAAHALSHIGFAGAAGAGGAGVGPAARLSAAAPRQRRPRRCPGQHPCRRALAEPTHRALG